MDHIQLRAGMFCTPKFWGFMGVQHPQIFEEKFCTPKFCTPESQMNPHIPRSARSCTPNLVVQISHGGAKILTLPNIFERFWTFQNGNTKIFACGAEMHQVRRMHWICEICINTDGWIYNFDSIKVAHTLGTGYSMIPWTLEWTGLIETRLQ